MEQQNTNVSSPLPWKHTFYAKMSDDLRQLFNQHLTEGKSLSLNSKISIPLACSDPSVTLSIIAEGAVILAVQSVPVVTKRDLMATVLSQQPLEPLTSLTLVLDNLVGPLKFACTGKDIGQRYNKDNCKALLPPAIIKLGRLELISQKSSRLQFEIHAQKPATTLGESQLGVASMKEKVAESSSHQTHKAKHAKNGKDVASPSAVDGIFRKLPSNLKHELPQIMLHLYIKNQLSIGVNEEEVIETLMKINHNRKQHEKVHDGQFQASKSVGTDSEKKLQGRELKLEDALKTALGALNTAVASITSMASTRKESNDDGAGSKPTLSNGSLNTTTPRSQGGFGAAFHRIGYHKQHTKGNFSSHVTEQKDFSRTCKLTIRPVENLSVNSKKCETGGRDFKVRSRWPINRDQSGSVQSFRRPSAHPKSFATASSTFHRHQRRFCGHYMAVPKDFFPCNYRVTPSKFFTALARIL